MNSAPTSKGVRVEVSLEAPQTRMKSKQLLFTSFTDISIDDSDLISISYAVDKISQLVNRMILIFKENEVADLFCKHIELKENTEKYSFINIIKNVLGNSEEDSLSRASTSDSIYVISDDSYFNQSLLIETSFFENNEFSLKSKQSSMESMIESTRSTLNGDDPDEPAENKLEIFSNKPIVDDDLDVIILFLESSKQSGGGDIIEFELNSNKRILLVNYQSSRAKKRVLEKKIHSFKDFKLIANEPFDETKFKLNKKAIVLRNISTKMDKEFVSLYAENLVVNDNEENDVEFLAASNLFVDTYYLRFKLDFDEDKLLNRLKKRMLNKKEVSFMRSFMTCTILVNQFDTKGKPVEPEMIEMYFLNKKRCGVENYISIRERDSFMLITFKDQESVYKILSNKHMIANQELVVEELVNFDLLSEEQILKQAPKSSRSSSESEKGERDQEEDVTEKKRAQEENDREDIPEKKQPQIEQNNKTLDDTLTFEDYVMPKKQDIPRPFINLTLDQEPNMKVLYYFDGTYMTEFTNELFDMEAGVLKQSDNSIKIECSEEDPNKYSEWNRSVNEYIRKFFDNFDVKTIRVNNVDEVIKQLDFDKLRANVKRVDEGSIELCGFKQLVTSLAQQIDEISREMSEDEKKVCEEQIENLTLNQIRVLLVHKYIKQMREKHQNFATKVDPKNKIVTLKGTRAQIKDAKQELNKILSMIVSRVLPSDEITIKFMVNKEIDIVTWLKNKDILCTLDPDLKKKIITIYSIDKLQLDKCQQAFKSDITTNELDINQIFENDDDEKLVEYATVFDKEEGAVVILDGSILRICGFKNKVEEIYEKCLHDMFSSA